MVSMALPEMIRCSLKRERKTVCGLMGLIVGRSRDGFRLGSRKISGSATASVFAPIGILNRLMQPPVDFRLEVSACAFALVQDSAGSCDDLGELA